MKSIKVILTFFFAFFIITISTAQIGIPIIRTIPKNSMANITTNLTNDLQIEINNTSLVRLFLYMAPTATSTPGSIGISVDAGAHVTYTVADIGGVSLGQFLNVANRESNLLSGTLSATVKAAGVPVGTTPDACGFGGIADPLASGAILPALGSWKYDFGTIYTCPRGTRVGIGTNNPTHSLDVFGDAFVQSSIIASMQKLTYGLSVGSTYYTITPPSDGAIFEGNVGIGTSVLNNDFKLSVNGAIRAKSIKVETAWPDYVFEKDYKLMSLTDLELFIKENKHLPEIKSEKEVVKDGADLGEMVKLQMQKIEELTLYLIAQEKKIENLEKRLAETH